MNKNIKRGEKRQIFFNGAGNIPIATRITLWYTFFIVLIFGIVISSVFVLGEKIALESSKMKLREEVNKIAENPKKIEGFDDGIFFSIYNDNGDQQEGKVPDKFDKSARLVDDESRTLKREGKEYIFYDKKNEDGRWIRGVIPVDKARSELKILLLIFVIVSPILIFLIVFFGYKIVKKGFRPVKKISDTALDIKNNRDFSKRINIGNGKDELHQIANAFNSMLDSLEKSYDKEKEFSTNVSHELRTPVSVIMAESEYALKHAKTLNEAKESISVILSSSKRMKKLINQILELSKIEKREVLDLTYVNITEFIDTALNAYFNIAKERNISFKINIENGIFGEIDETMMIRLIDNLVGNAIKFTKTRIEVKVKNLNDNYEISIADDGIGICKKDLNKIWNRFFQSNESRNKEENEGNGLGLSLVRKIVKLHRGEIFAESTLGLGSTFTVRFPKINSR